MAEKKAPSKQEKQKQKDIAMECMQGMDFMKDWNTWRQSVKSAIEHGRQAGLKDEEMKQTAVEVSNYLAEKICPATPEEHILKEMWQTASEQERKMLAGVIFKMMSA